MKRLQQFTAVLLALPSVSIALDIDRLVSNLKGNNAELKILCTETLNGFFLSGDCYEFEGTTIKGVQVRSECAGQCAIWASCLTDKIDPVLQCAQAKKFVQLRGNELEDDDTTVDWSQIILICVRFLSIIVFFFCIAAAIARTRHLGEKTQRQVKREYFD